MPRAPNRNDPTPLAIVLTFKPHEFRALKHNEPGPAGVLGGYQKHENLLKRLTDPETLELELPPVLLTRTIKYCSNYGPGGPNKRIREACIPALRRAGIDLQSMR